MTAPIGGALVEADPIAVAPAISSGRRIEVRTSVLLALVLSVVWLSYAQVTQGDFVWDDHALIEEYPLTQELHPLSSYLERRFWSDPTRPESRSFYRPLVSLSYALEWQLWSGQPAGFHFTNLVLHLACCGLVFALARRMGAAPLPASLAAALFGTLPRLTESVAWISGRTDILATLGVLAALLVHRTRPNAMWTRIAAAGLLFLALLSKEVAAAGVLAVIAMEVAERRHGVRSWFQTARHLAPAGLASLAYLALHVRAWAPELVGEEDPFTTIQHLLWFPLQALGTYFVMVLDPLRPRAQIGQLGIVEWPLVGLGLVAACGIALVLARAWRRAEAKIFAVAVLAAAALVPVLHVVPLAVNIVAADRFLYLPVAASAALGARMAGALPRRAMAAFGVLAVALLVSFVIATQRRVPVWGDDLVLWQTAAANAPRGNALVFDGLGAVLSWRGDPEGAVDAYSKALAVQREFSFYPDGRSNPSLVSNLALALSEVGRYDEALDLLGGVVASNPRSPLHLLRLGAVQARALHFDAAEASIQKALDLVPEFPLAQQLSSQVRTARDRWRALPLESTDEALPTKAERAAIFSKIGRLRDADRLWSQVAEDPGVTPTMLTAAAIHLSTRGIDPQAARRVLQRMRERGAPEARVAQLEQVLSDRKLIESKRPATRDEPRTAIDTDGSNVPGAG